MKESQLLGTLLPSHPDFLKVEEAIREKYCLREVSPEEDPITEIYLGDEIITFKEFRKDIENLVRENLSFLPPEILKVYLPSKRFSEPHHEPQLKGIDLLPDDFKKMAEESIKFIKIISDLVIQIVDPMINSIVNMLYIYLLTGETQEVPDDWISKVATLEMVGEPMVMAMAGPMANLDVITQQFREEYKKTFGNYRPRVTKTVTSTAYYFQLKKARKPWKYIVEEYIRLNKFRLPRDRTSKRYQDTLRKIEQRLKKRMQRTEVVFESLIRDKK